MTENTAEVLWCEVQHILQSTVTRLAWPGESRGEREYRRLCEND